MSRTQASDAMTSGGGRSLGAKISGGRGRPGGTIFGFYKTRHILLSESANCTVLRAVVLTQYGHVTDKPTDRRTDGQTDGITVTSTALAMRALRRAVKTSDKDLHCRQMCEITKPGTR